MAEITKEQMGAYIAEEDRRKAVYDWRKARSDEMPKIMARVFALRGAGYMGCGFHYSLEARAGTLMGHMSPEREVTFAGYVGDQIAWDMLISDIEKAEKSTSYYPVEQYPEQAENNHLRLAFLRSRFKPVGKDRHELAATFLRLLDKHGRDRVFQGIKPMWLEALEREGYADQAMLLNLVYTETDWTRPDASKTIYRINGQGEALLAEMKQQKEIADA